jgi:hypothetical protein
MTISALSKEIHHLAVRDCLQDCVYQMEMCEKMFRDDEDFMRALNEAREVLASIYQKEGA